MSAPLTMETIRALPKVELHCHLDGSVPLGIGGLTEENAKAPPRCSNLVEYLNCFGPAIACLQNMETLAQATGALAQTLAGENVVYAELRFAPTFLLGGTTNGTSSTEVVVRTVLDAMQKAEAEHGVVLRALLCMMRHLPEKENAEVLELASHFRHDGVCGVDLAGDEAAFPPARFEGLYRKAHQMGLHRTLHAGEAAGAENVRTALDFGVERIGHGIASAQDEALMAALAENGVLLEICPISNLQTKAIARWEDYPLIRFLDAGVHLSVNTDNRTVSSTSLTNEFYTLAKHFPQFTLQQMEQVTCHALSAAFLPEQEKSPLAEKIKNGYARFSK